MHRRDTFFAETAAILGAATPDLSGGGAIATILESITDAVFILDARWRFVYLNTRAEALLRRERGELLGSGIWAEFPDVVGTVFEEQYRRAMVTGCPGTFEALFPSLATWVEVRAYPSALGLLVAIQDITARKAVEATLREGEARYRDLYAAAERQARELALLDQVRQAVTRELEPVVLYRTVVAAIAATFGYTRVGVAAVEDGWLVGQEAVGLDHRPMRLPLTQGIVGRVARSGQAELIVDVCSDPDFLGERGETVSEICVPLCDDGRVVGVLNVESIDGVALSADDLRQLTALSELVGVGITRTRLYATVQERERHYRLLLEQASDAIFLTDRTGRYLDVNPQACALLGYTRDELLQLSVQDVIPASELDARSLHVAGHGGGDTVMSERQIRRKDGMLVPVEASLRVLPDGGTQAIVRDITARKAAEEALRAEERHSRELLRAAERQARELALLDQVRAALARELDPAVVYRAVVEAVAATFGYARVMLCLVRGDALVPVRMVGYDHLLDRVIPSIPLGLGVSGRVARTGQPVLLADVATDPDFIDIGDGTLSEVCVPIFDEGRVIGVLNVESTGGMRLGEADLRLMTAVSEHVGLAVARARLYAEARASAALLAEAQRIAHLGSWEYDLARDEGRWSDEVYRILGYAPQAFAPSPTWIHTAMHPEDRERFERANQALVECGTPFDLDYRIVRPDGEVRILHQQGENVRDAAGLPAKRVGIVQDVTEQRALEGQLRHQALHDALTGLPNRVLFLDRLGQALARAARDGQPCAVLFLDLDRFKTVNDSLGHHAGDQLLVTVAARLRACARAVDTVARFGGDEFAVLLDEATDADAAARVAERLAAALARPFPLAGHEHRVTASIGIVLTSGDYARAEDLLRDADVAMYRAKAAGKARYTIFDPAMQAELHARLALERDLAWALERRELLVHYQPIVDLTTGCIAGVEALVRWQHPARGLVSPGEFIPLAEETGLILAIGEWVLEESCRQVCAWQARYPDAPPLELAVNLSARELVCPELVPAVGRVLRETGLDPQHLKLEITESAAMADAGATVGILGDLRALGVRLAIDDFGTGYSSLGYLKRFPVDTLKVDKSFVDGLGRDPEDTAIVQAVLTLADTLGLAVTAEGVEAAGQLAQLRALRCAMGQGYYFAPPLPAAEFEALWAAGTQFDLSGGEPVPGRATLELRTVAI